MLHLYRIWKAKLLVAFCGWMVCAQPLWNLQTKLGPIEPSGLVWCHEITSNRVINNASFQIYSYDWWTSLCLRNEPNRVQQPKSVYFTRVYTTHTSHLALDPWKNTTLLCRNLRRWNFGCFCWKTNEGVQQNKTKIRLSVLWKSLNCLYFARKVGNKCSGLLKRVQT